MNLSEIVSFPGRIPWDEVPKYLAASDIFVLPSQRDEAGNLDGLPTVLLEAMACGLPCVASDVGGVSLVIDQAKNGFLISPKSSSELTEGLRSLIEDKDLRDRFSAAARSSVVDRFNWDNVGKKFETICQEILSGQSQRESL